MASPSASPASLSEMEEHAGAAERLLRAMANRHRLMVLCALAEGELSVGALNERVQLSQSALSQHLAVLRNDGLVTTRRESQTIYYSVTAGPALQIVRVLHEAYCCAPAATAPKPRRAAPRSALTSAPRSVAKSAASQRTVTKRAQRRG